MTNFNEKTLAEDYFVENLQKVGWILVPPNALERESFDEPLLTTNLIRALKQLNESLGIEDEEIKQVINQLKLKGTGVEGTKQILNYFQNGVPTKFEKERLIKRIKLFNYDEPLKNEFIISRQVIHRAADNSIRNDIILYVNGIPLVNIECKSPIRLTEDWYKAFQDIVDYEQAVPELYKYVQLGIAAEETVKYFPIVPWQQEETKIHQWRSEEHPTPIDATIEMLTPCNLLNIIQNYLFIRVEQGKAGKVITRYMQYRAAERIYKRAVDYQTGKDSKNKGLIWHWQGSGKTLTMIFAANKLFNESKLQNPTVFFIVDREDLQEQLWTEYNALDITPKPEVTQTMGELRRLLIHDEGKGKRGIFVCLVQKWRPEEFDKLRKELDDISKDRDTIQTRKNVITFIDEGHRTQYGTLAGQMKKILKNAQKYAFTGTPIAKELHNTYTEFSYPPEENYLDRYFITDAILDGFTVPIAHQLRLEEDTRLPTTMIDAFLQVEIDEIPEQYQHNVEEKTKRKLNKVNLFLENENRITKVAKDIAAHFRENLDGKFKGIIVAASRKACVTYKRQLDKLLPPEYSEIVMTFNDEDTTKMPSAAEYKKELIAKHNGKDIETIRKEIIEKYKEETFPKILIVTDMLLTGFDAPILQTMYLDKPLKDHRLLQAVARTNRPYKDIKQAGLILDYVGILRNLQKAFEKYAKEDIDGTIQNIDEIVQEFNSALDETMKLFENIPKDQFNLSTMRKATEIITIEEQNTKMFLENIKRLRKLFEFLGPNPIKIERFNEYKWLMAVYLYYQRIVNPPNPIENKYAQAYFDKTLKFVYKTTELEDIQDNLPIIAFDDNYLQNLTEKIKNKEEKAANMMFSLYRFTIADRENSPITETILERVKRLLKLWKERTKNYDLINIEGTQIINDLAQLESRRKQLNFDNAQYAILLTLEKEFPQDNSVIQDTRELTALLNPLMFKDWQTQPTGKKNVERQIRTYIRKYIKQHGLTLEQIDTLNKKIFGMVQEYGKT